MPAEEILRGAKSIAEAIGLPRRSVYHHAAAGRLPTFRIGTTLCARRSSVDAWLAARTSDAIEASTAAKVAARG